MGFRGPVGLPPDKLKEIGQWKPNRHAGRQAPPVAQGVPTPPAGLADPGKTLWFQVVDHLQSQKLAGEVDSATIEMACRTYNLLKRAHDAAEADPLDKDARIAVNEYSRVFLAYSTKLGINPMDRQRMQQTEPDKPEDDELC